MIVFLDNSGKQAVIKFFSCVTLYIPISNYIEWLNSGYFYFDLLQFTQSECVKADFSWNCSCPVKQAVLLLLSSKAMYSNLEINNVLIQFFLFWFPTVYPNFMYISHLFFNFLRVRKKSSDMASFVEHPVYCSLKMYSLFILVFLFWLTTIHSK